MIKDSKEKENKDNKEDKIKEDSKEKELKEKEELKYKEKIEDLTDTLQRLQADFENYKKHIEKRYLDSNKRIKADLINRLLPILDSFELGLKNTKDQEEFKKGIELIFSQFFQILEDMGLRKIELNGKFDPYKHEVLITEESDKEEGTILKELQKGYMIEDMVLRHTKVKVAKNKSVEKTKEQHAEKRGDDNNG
jgi:molecular chaperone GrpE